MGEQRGFVALLAPPVATIATATNDYVRGLGSDIDGLGRDVNHGRTRDHHGGRRCHIGNSYWLHSAAGE